MASVFDVFTPSSTPTLTYVDRSKLGFEAKMAEGLKVPGLIVSLSGPSKSGKTVLFTKIVPPENIIPVPGPSIRKPEELWTNVLTWIEAPSSKTISRQDQNALTAT